MKRQFISFISGLVVGFVVLSALIWFTLPSLMLEVHKSRLDFPQTISAIENAIKAQGWKMPKLYDLSKSLQADGYHVAPMTVMSLCRTEHLAKVVDMEENRRLMAMMPCRFGIYQTADNSVYITQMNVGLLGRVFGGEVGRVMAQVASEEAIMLKDIVN